MITLAVVTWMLLDFACYVGITGPRWRKAGKSRTLLIALPINPIAALIRPRCKHGAILTTLRSVEHNRKSLYSKQPPLEGPSVVHACLSCGKHI